MGVPALQPAPLDVTLFASAVRTTAISNSASDISRIAWKKAVFLLDVTATAGVAGDTLDVYIDVLGPGSTWLNAGHFTQVAGNSAAIKHFMVLDATNVAATTFNVTTDCTTGVTKPYVWGKAFRARYTLVDAGAHGQSVTFSVSGLLVR